MRWTGDLRPKSKVWNVTGRVVDDNFFCYERHFPITLAVRNIGTANPIQAIRSIQPSPVRAKNKPKNMVTARATGIVQICLFEVLARLCAIA